MNRWPCSTTGRVSTRIEWSLLSPGGAASSYMCRRVQNRDVQIAKEPHLLHRPPHRIVRLSRRAPFGDEAHVRTR